MDKESKKYLDTEREISEFRAESLRKMLNKGEPSTKRLLAIEEEFLKIRFEDMATTLPELLSAIKIFRDSRQAFQEIYQKELSPIVCDNIANLSSIISPLKEEISRYSTGKVESSIKDIRACARVCIILLSMLIYLEKTEKRISDLKLKLDSKLLLSEILKQYEYEIFSFYNDVILLSNDFEFIPSKLRNAISDTKPLVLLSKSNYPDFFSLKKETLKGKPLFGMFMPIKHSGRETLRTYNISIIDSNGENVSRLFSLNSKNVLCKEKGEYYKFISMMPFSSFSDNISLQEKYNLFMKKIYDDELGNEKNTYSVSSVSTLIPSSRTEDDSLKEAFSTASAIISGLINKFID
jgi:hypothetical protein